MMGRGGCRSLRLHSRIQAGDSLTDHVGFPCNVRHRLPQPEGRRIDVPVRILLDELDYVYRVGAKHGYWDILLSDLAGIEIVPKFLSPCTATLLSNGAALPRKVIR